MVGDREGNFGTRFLHVLLTDMRRALELGNSYGQLQLDGEDSTPAAINAVLAAVSGNLRPLRKTSRPSVLDVLGTFGTNPQDQLAARSVLTGRGACDPGLS